MAIPKYDELYNSVLLSLSDQKEHSLKELVLFCSDTFNLTIEEREKRMEPSGKVYIKDRTGWALTYLKKAGLVKSEKRSFYQITDIGLKAVNSGRVIDNDYLKTFSSFCDFQNTSNPKNSNKNSAINPDSASYSLSPQEQIEQAISEINKSLADDLMVEVMKMSSYDFEHFVIKLLVAMGYGSMLNNENAVTAKSGDEGIDGVLTADKLGFDSIYIQAKQWKLDSTVGRPEIQKFVGAMAGQGAIKGLFITTARFSKEAVDFANKNLTSKVVLIDGSKLANLMIEYDLGVSTVATYKIKRIDTDFFIED